MTKDLKFGKDFGSKKTPDFLKEYKKFNKNFLLLIIDEIKSGALIADYGGGNAIFSKDLIKLCKKRKICVKVENIDIDVKKFVKTRNLYNIRKDVTKYRFKERYNCAISRHLMHYLNMKGQKKFLRNVRYNLKPGGYFLLVSWAVDNPESRKVKRKILDKVESYTGISRPVMITSKNLIKTCKSSGFSIVKQKKFNYRLSIDDFYKNRFGLKDSEIKAIKNGVGVASHSQSQIGILMRT